MNHTEKAEEAEDSVIVRSVPLSRKQVPFDPSRFLLTPSPSFLLILFATPCQKHQKEVGSGEMFEFSAEYKLFELGVSIAGNYVLIRPKNDGDLIDLFKTSGLGLDQGDEVFLFKVSF